MNTTIFDNYSRRLYCGPAALAAIAGIPAQLAVAMCEAISGSPEVAQWWHLSRALFPFGWRIEIDDPARGKMMSELKGLNLVIVQTGTESTHYVVVEDGMMLDAHNNPAVKISPEKDRPTLHVWRVSKLAHNEPVLYNRF